MKINDALKQGRTDKKPVLLNVSSPKCSDSRGVNTLIKKNKLTPEFIVYECDVTRSAEWRGYTKLAKFALPMLVFLDPFCNSILQRSYGATTPGTLTARMKSSLAKFKKRNGLAIVLLLCSLLMAGCVSGTVPSTRITGSIAGKPFALVTPKDSELSGLAITANAEGVTVKLDKLSTRMNPDNISQTGEAQAKIIAATGEAVTKAVTKAATESVKATVIP